MPVNITDVDTFTDPIVAPADSDPADRTYVLTIAQGVANRTRHLANRIGGAGGAGEWLYPAARTRTMWVPGIDFQPSHTLLSAAPDWNANGDVSRTSRDDALTCALNVTTSLQTGQVLTRIDLLVDPGAARGSGSRLSAALARYDYPTPPTAAAPTLVPLASAEQASSGHALQYLVFAVSFAIARATGVFHLLVTSGNDGAHVPDVLYGAFLTFTDPGPRNF